MPEKRQAIDASTNTVTSTAEVGVSPRELAVTPDGRIVLVANYRNNTVLKKV